MTKRKSPGYWREWTNVKKTFLKVEKMLGHFPTSKELQTEKLGSLAVAVSKAHGGMNGVRKKLGLEQGIKPRGYWQDINNVKNEFRQIIKYHPEFKGKIPSSTWLMKNGYSSLAVSIIKYHGGYISFRRFVRAEVPQIESGQWRNLEYTLREIRKLMQEHSFDTLPGSWTLRKLGYNSLAAAIQKYHGGYSSFREQFNFKLGISKETKKLENLLENYAGGKDD